MRPAGRSGQGEPVIEHEEGTRLALDFGKLAAADRGALVHLA
jgi:hypothetical protein